jgi:hypothetical protein
MYVFGYSEVAGDDGIVTLAEETDRTALESR